VTAVDSVVSQKTVATALVDALRDLGVRYVFGVPSGGWVDYMEAIRSAADIEFVLTTHEGGAGMMADVCGRLGDAPGVCFGTFGPGATNLATGVGEAFLDRSPMIAFTDEMPAELRGRTVQMGIDHQALFRPLTKATMRLDAAHVRSTIFAAAQIALSGRPGPVHIGLPVGLSAERATPEDVAFVPPLPPPHANEAKLTSACDLFEAASRPLLAVGLGAVNAGVASQVVAFANKHRLPVVLTPMAKGILAETAPNYAGVLFHALSDIVASTHAQADVVVAIGYDPVEFNYESWLSSTAMLINIDVEPADIHPETCRRIVDVVGDIGHSLSVLHQLPARRNEWKFSEIAARREAMFYQLRASSDILGPKTVLRILRDVLPPDGIMTCDVGAHTRLIGQAWETPTVRSQLMTNGWSTMGFGIPSAIGAKFMRPERTVCTVVGDGGFLMTAGELATASRYNIKIVVVLMSDDDLALIRIKQQKKMYPIYGTSVRSSGTSSLGDSIFGVPVRTVCNAADLRRELAQAFMSDGPVIVEAIVDSREYDELVLKKDK
jgi:acetolactate synthase I/II/III large subunit